MSNINTMIGVYHITKKLGSGEYGDVYLATNTKTKTKVAIK